MEFRLKRLGQENQKKIFKIQDKHKKKVWLAGRGSCCHIYTNSKYASRKHFSITYKNENFFIEDLQSANGTFVDNMKITEEVMLHPGNVISVGVPFNLQDVPDSISYIFELNIDNISVEKMNSSKESDDIYIINEPCTTSVIKQNIYVRNIEALNRLPHPLNESTLPASLSGIRNISLAGESYSDYFKTFAKSENFNERLKQSTKESESSIRKQFQDQLETLQEPIDTVTPGTKNDADMTKNHNLGSCNSKINISQKSLESEITEKESYGINEYVIVDKETCSTGKFDIKTEMYFEEDVVEHKLNYAVDNDDLKYYGALTQVDENVIKTEGHLLDYSQAEELIVISDSEEEDWCSKLNNLSAAISENKINKVNGDEDHYDDVDDDDIADVVFIEEIIKSSESSSHQPAPLANCKEDDELTETDMKWVAKLKSNDSDNPFFKNFQIGDLKNEKNKGEKISDRPLATEITGVRAVKQVLNEEINVVNNEVNKAIIRPCVVKLPRISVVEEVTNSASSKKNVPEKIAQVNGNDKQTQDAEENSQDEIAKIRQFLMDTSPSTSSERKRSNPDGREENKILAKKMKSVFSLSGKGYRVRNTSLLKSFNLDKKRKSHNQDGKNGKGKKINEKKREIISKERKTRLAEISLRQNKTKLQSNYKTKISAPIKVKNTLKSRSEYLLEQTIAPINLRDSLSNGTRDDLNNEKIMQKSCHKKVQSNSESHCVQLNIPKDSLETCLPYIKSNASNVRELKSCLKKMKQLTVSKKSVTFNMVLSTKEVESVKFMELDPVEKKKVQFTNIISCICNWNSRWLEESKYIPSEKVPPGLCAEPTGTIPNEFVCQRDYMTTFISQILLNLWNKIKNGWSENEKKAFRQTIACDTYEDCYSKYLRVCKCTGLVRNVEVHKQLLREGQVVLLRLHQRKNTLSDKPVPEKYSKKTGYLVFAYIEKKVYERFDKDKSTINKTLAEMSATFRGDLHLVKLSILVRDRPYFVVDKTKLVQLTVIQNISQQLKINRGICLLSDSPLCNAIMAPSKTNFSLLAPPETMSLDFKESLDSCQRDLVSKLTYTTSATSFFLYSIHGAAGTGKTRVILAFMMQLLYRYHTRNYSKKPKIIYSTHSGIALDEMVEKLKNYRQNLEKSVRFNLVRVGRNIEIKPSVREFSLPNLVCNRNPGYKKNCKANEFHDSAEAEIQILKEADIICITCSCNILNKVMLAFEEPSLDKSQQIICILDEAQLSSELETVLLLQLKVTHLFLFGDVHQVEPKLPGERTRPSDSDTSLFFRIFRNFSNTRRELAPIFTLKKQFRMNPSILRILNEVIYCNRVRNSVESISHEIPNLQSCLLLADQFSGLEPEEERIRRKGELVVQLIRSIITITKHIDKFLNIFVVTCGPEQNQFFQSTLTKSEFPFVEVNQIHRFQEREADIVVFIFDGSPLLNCRLITALTRARRSLIILTTPDSIQNNKLFEKLWVTAQKEKILRYITSDLVNKKQLENILRIK